MKKLSTIATIFGIIPFWLLIEPSTSSPSAIVLPPVKGNTNTAPPAPNVPGKVESKFDTIPPVTELESAKAAKAAAERFPVYVIPEAIAVQTPVGMIVFAERWHVEELSRKYPAHRLTNVVVWSR